MVPFRLRVERGRCRRRTVEPPGGRRFVPHGTMS